MVQVYAPSGKTPEFQSGSWDDEDMNGYELMNEVGSGGTLSSLFTILSLFTEDINMSWPMEKLFRGEDNTTTDDGFLRQPFLRSRPRPSHSSIPELELEHGTPVQTSRSRSFSGASPVSSGSTVLPDIGQSSPPMRSRTLSHDSDFTRTSNPLHRPNQPRRMQTQIHHGTIARATEDTTLAVIPAEAFRRLTKKFPKATAHIVQGA